MCSSICSESVEKTKQKRSSFACKLPALFGIARGVFYSNPPKKIKWLMKLKSGSQTFIIIVLVINTWSGK